MVQVEVLLAQLLGVSSSGKTSVSKTDDRRSIRRTPAEMKRYLLFAGDNYYPCGGWNDFEGSFDTKEEIKIEERFYQIWERKHFPEGKSGDKAYEKQLQPRVCGYTVNGKECDWYHVIDTENICFET